MVTPKLLCTSLFVLLCIVSIHCDSFYINAAADGSSTDCSEVTPCQSFSQVINIFPGATAYDLNVAPGVYNGSNNTGLVFTVPVSIQSYSSNGQDGTVIINAGTFEGAVINATNSIAIKGITMLAEATTPAQTILLVVDSLQPLTLQQVNLTTVGSGIGMQVYNAVNITISSSFVTSASINITAASVTISNTVFANTAYPAIALYNVPTVVIDSSQFNQAEVVTSYCYEITLSNSVFNSPLNTLNNSASFLSDYGQNIHVSNVSMTVTEPSIYIRYGLRLPTLQGNLTIDSFQLSGSYSEGIVVANGTSATITNVNISDTTMSAIVLMHVENFYLSQFYFSNCMLGVNYSGQSTSAIVKMNEGIVSNALFFGALNSASVSAGEISNVQIQVTAYVNTTIPIIMSVTSGSWLISNLTATSTTAQPFYCIIYAGAPSTKSLTLEVHGVNFSGFFLTSGGIQFRNTPDLNFTITDSTFSNISLTEVGNSIIDAMSTVRAVIHIDNCEFSNSVMTAIVISKSTLVDIRNSVFSNMSVPKDPMVTCIVSIDTVESVSVSNSSFIGNTFLEGALAIVVSEAVIFNCTFSNNVGVNSGGFSTFQTSGFNMSGCSFTNNTVQEDGGAISSDLYELVNTTSITNTTFTGNNGSGVYLYKSYSEDSYTVFVSDLIFNDNTKYAIECANGITIEYQGDVTINGKDSKDDIYGCIIIDSSDGNIWVWVIVAIVVIAFIILILGAIVAAVVIMKRKRSSYVSLDDE